MSRTSATLLTPPGRGAVAVVRIEGDLGLLDRPTHLFLATNGCSAADQHIGRIAFGRWGADAAEDVVFCRIDETTAEVQCHGGRAAVERILADLSSRGVTIESSDEYLVHNVSWLDAETLRSLTNATTRRTAAILADQHGGLLRAALQQVRDRADLGEQLRLLDDLLRWSRFGEHLTRPWSVVVCGRPNVGKSSLINALAGFARSIVYDQPGTTRDVVTVETAFDGWPVELSDTAGLRETVDDIEAEGVTRAQRRIESADLILLVLDRSLLLTAEDEQLLARLDNAIVVAHKRDLPSAWVDKGPAGTIPVSSLTGVGQEQLIETIVTRLVPEVPSPGTAIPVSQALVQQLARFRNSLLSGKGSSQTLALLWAGLGTENDGRGHL